MAPKPTVWQVMANVYASAVGTTVLQIKEIPPRPARFDGAICLFGLKEGTSEAAIREVLSQFGEIIGFELDRDPAVVRFNTHDAAIKAKERYPRKEDGGTTTDLFSGLDTQYNERQYDGRGWCALLPCTCSHKTAKTPSRRHRCCFEDAVSGELLARLSVYPQLKALLDDLPPKLAMPDGSKPSRHF